MILGFLLLGVLAGSLGAGAALITGHSIGLALLAYAGAGLTGTLLGIAASLLPGRGRDTGDLAAAHRDLRLSN
jgi:hypothetical protein